MSEKDTQVLVVGCGLTGSSIAVFLRGLGIPTLAIERRTTDFPWPRTRMILGRSMELYRTAGLEADIRERASMFADFPDMARAESIAGAEWMRDRIEGFAAGDDYSPCPWAPIDQHRLEPVLRGRARDLGATIEFGHRLVALDQDDDAVTATVAVTGSTATRTIRADYLVATDGADSTVARHLGITMRGPSVVARYVNIVWEADITAPLADRRVGLWFLDHPRPGSVLMPQGKQGRWILMVPHDPASGETLADFTDERCVELIRAAVGVPRLDVTLVAMTGEDAAPVARSWEIGACVAREYRHGRVFLVGDSAHQLPPTGAFGANLGIQDAHNLAWKLAMVLRGHADPDLLDTYHDERVPVADVTVDAATEHLRVRTEAGGEGNTTGGNLAVVFGYRYRSRAILAEGDDNDDDNNDNNDNSSDAMLVHPAKLRGSPGTRAPHLWLLSGDALVSSIDLYAHGFVLVAGVDGGAWAAAARAIAAASALPLTAIHLGRDVVDPHDAWPRAHQVTAAGTVLVRPDGFVAWRSVGAATDHEEALRHVLRRLLASRSMPAHT